MRISSIALVLGAIFALVEGPNTCFGEEVLYRPWRMWHGYSEDGSYVARVVVGERPSMPARLSLFHYDRAKKAYLPVAEHDLSMQNLPLEVHVSPNGKYVATLGKKHADYDDLSHALWLWDVERNVARDYSVSDFMTPEQINRYVRAVPMFGGGLWFSGDPVFSPDGATLFIDLSIASVPGASDFESRMRTRFKVACSRPVAVVNFRTMSVRMVDRRELPMWKRRLDEAVYGAELASTIGGIVISPRQSAELSLIRRTMRCPKVEFRASAPWKADKETWIARLDPGGDGTMARMTVYRYLRDRNVYQEWKAVQLANPVAPCDWLVTPDAHYVVTFDEIDSIGVGNQVIGIYRLVTGESETYRLEDFLTRSWLEKIEGKSNWRSRIWRPGGRNIVIVGQSSDVDWGRRRHKADWLPEIMIDLDDMSVRVLDP